MENIENLKRKISVRAIQVKLIIEAWTTIQRGWLRQMHTFTTPITLLQSRPV